MLSGMLRVNFFDGFERIDFDNTLVRSDANDPWETQGITAGMPIAFLDSVEGNFDHNIGLDGSKTAVILDRLLFDILRHLCDSESRSARLGLADIQPLPGLLDRERIVRKHIAPPAMAELDTCHNNVQCCESFFPFEPTHAALTGKVERS